MAAMDEAAAELITHAGRISSIWKLMYKDSQESESSVEALNLWINFVKYATTHPKAKENVYTAVRYVGMVERHTTACDTNLKECYDFLAALVSGKEPKEVTNQTRYFVMLSLALMLDIIKKEGLLQQIEKYKKPLIRSRILQSFSRKDEALLRNFSTDSLNARIAKFLNDIRCEVQAK